MERTSEDSGGKDAARDGSPATNSPVHKLRYGAVDAAVWKNIREGMEGEFFSVTLSKRFKHGEDWKESKSFDERDLPTVAKAANDAHSWIQGAKLPRRERNQPEE
jgi:hypothetical protein